MPHCHQAQRPRGGVTGSVVVGALPAGARSRMPGSGERVPAVGGGSLPSGSREGSSGGASPSAGRT